MFSLQRLLVERMESRILVGTVAFLAIMVLVGWIAINEGGRMQAFERQYMARSIERGASLFVNNCSECHGIDGRGGTGAAPALNSPHLFGYSYLAGVDAEATTLTAERDAEGTTDARRAEIDARLTELETQRADLLAQMQPAIDKGYNPEAPSRLQDLGWGGTLASFVETTLVHGRPTSSSYWPRPMAAWAQEAGGPLRRDQLEDLTNFVLNWDRGSQWTVEDLNAVNQFPIRPVDPSTVVTDPDAPARVGTETPTEDIVAELANYQGDPNNGQALYNGTLACATCHLNAAVAPPTEGTWTRVQEERLAEPQFEGYTGEAYLAESIIHPNEYIAPGYVPAMPQDFGARLTYQDLADLIAYLQTHDEQ